MNTDLHKRVIVCFFLGLAMMAGIELRLVWEVEGSFYIDLWQLALAVLLGASLFYLGLAVWTGSG